MPVDAAEPFENQCHSILSTLDKSGGTVRKQAGAWIVQSPGQRGGVEVSPGVVAALLAKGHLVPHPSGALQSRAWVAKAGSRLASHRVERPPSEASAPTFNDAESPLAWLRSRKAKNGKPMIGDEQFLAGERLRADYERSRLERRITSSWEMSQTAGGSSGNRVADMTDAMISARQSFHAALDAVGPELSGMLVQVCCLSAGIEQAERLLEMPQRAGKAVLGLALTSLARHYGFLKQSRGSDRGLAIGHWAAGDYRPLIPPRAGS